MEHYQKSSHTVYDIKYHVVRITKQRYLKGYRKLEEFVRQFASDRFSFDHKIDTNRMLLIMKRTLMSQTEEIITGGTISKRP
jgi:adenylyl- and sulfurtransferase ThiI